MRKGTDKKRGAAISAGVIIAGIIIYLALIISAVSEGNSTPASLIFIAVIYGLIFLAIISGILFALRQRFREIDSGEEDEAKKY